MSATRGAPGELVWVRDGGERYLCLWYQFSDPLTLCYSYPCSSSFVRFLAISFPSVSFDLFSYRPLESVFHYQASSALTVMHVFTAVSVA
jgi:hypothetical protein